MINRKITLVAIANTNVNLYIVIKNILQYYNINYNIGNKYFNKIYNIITLINNNKNINYNKRNILI